MKKKSQPRIGILGGGQLAQMLCTEGAKWGLELHVLSESQKDPAALMTPNWVKGNPHSFKAIEKFAKRLTHLTFESEFVDADLLLQLQKKNRRLQIFPSPESLQLLQDRKTQKQLFDISGLPTAFWLSFGKKLKQGNISKLLWNLFPRGFVLKQRRHGYDGYGTFIFKSKSSKKLPSAALTDFIAEEFIPFKRELALLVGRTRSGKFFSYPLVETSQVNAQCDWVMGPHKHPREKALLAALKTFLQDLKYVGVMGVELFETKDGRLVINEIAPRVHNSAHYTLTAFNISQFAAHLFAGIGRPLPKLKAASKNFAMVNLLGQSRRSPRFPSKISGELFWYGKNENRPRRKMGHINMAGNSKTILKTLLKERQQFKL